MRPLDTNGHTELVRQRLAKLAASFDHELPPAGPVARATQRAPSTPPGRPPSHAAEVAWRWPPGRLRVVMALLVAAGVVLSWWLLSARPRTSEPTAVRLTTQSTSGSTSGSSSGPGSGGGLIIDVEGKVKRPGIVTLPRGARVHQAIAKAGGVVDSADTSTLNLARVLVDGEQVIVGAASPSGVAAPGVGATAAQPGRVSLNSATLEQLDTLPGVGPVTAQAIIDFRTAHGGFQRVEDLLEVKGIGAATLADLKDQVSP